MNTRHDDPQFRDLCRWYADEAHPDDMRNPKDLRWLVIAFFGALLIALALLVAGRVEAQVVCEWNADCIDWNYNALGGTPSGITSHRVEMSRAASGPWTALTIVPMPAMAYKRSPVDGTNYYRVVTNYNTGDSPPSNIASSTTVPPPMLITIGGLVWEAWPNWTNFSWKLGAQAGTIVAGVKCDATRRIGDSYYRVTAPIVWTNGKKNYVVAKCERKA